GMAEGVGFEPTVGFPTLDLESSALNRTQPPFRDEKRTSNPRTPKASAWQALNVQHPTQTATRSCLRGGGDLLGAAGWVSRGESLHVPRRPGQKHDFRLTRQKNVTIKGLPC